MIDYLINTFKLNINLPNQDYKELLLIYAYYNAYLDAALALLRHSADPKGNPLG
jgi:hypothetical protein